jgi:glycerophosphoryl diester phosphodiesterase
MPCDRCLKGYKETLNFTKTYVTGILPWKPFIIPYKGIDADYHGTPGISIRMEREVDDADKTVAFELNVD